MANTLGLEVALIGVEWHTLHTCLTNLFNYCSLTMNLELIPNIHFGRFGFDFSWAIILLGLLQYIDLILIYLVVFYVE